VRCRPRGASERSIFTGGRGWSAHTDAPIWRNQYDAMAGRSGPDDLCSRSGAFRVITMVREIRRSASALDGSQRGDDRMGDSAAPARERSICSPTTASPMRAESPIRTASTWLAVGRYVTALCTPGTALGGRATTAAGLRSHWPRSRATVTTGRSSELVLAMRFGGSMPGPLRLRESSGRPPLIRRADCGNARDRTPRRKLSGNRNWPHWNPAP
jgi:hypothetical protein